MLRDACLNADLAPQTLQDIPGINEHSVLLLVVCFGATRLIDNHYVLKAL